MRRSGCLANRASWAAHLPRLSGSVGVASLARMRTLLLLSSLLLLGCTNAKIGHPSGETRTHSFAIYSVTGTPRTGSAAEPWSGELASLTLEAVPVISDANIVSYYFADHTMVVKPQVVSHLPHPPVWHIPFVVVADGQRIYLGAFSTQYSSQSACVPSITVDHIALDAEHWWLRGGTNALLIDRGYPVAGFGVGPDPRSDGRVLQALAGLKKLK
jgi:hypothetical protein